MGYLIIVMQSLIPTIPRYLW